MPKEEFVEKRKFVRFLVSIPLKYAKLSIAPLEMKTAATKDISAQGLGLITAEELPVNTPLRVSLTIPDNGEEIPLEAEVVWSRMSAEGLCSSGLAIKNTSLKPIPLVLRTLNSRF
jgi:hypothetical protein